jgi:hypothetical protein
MKELNDDMDNLFRESLDSSEIIPSQGVWNSIEQRLNQQQATVRRERRLFYLWYAIPAFILCAGATQYFLLPFTPPASLTDTKHFSAMDPSKIPTPDKTQQRASDESSKSAFVKKSVANKPAGSEKNQEASKSLHSEEPRGNSFVRDAAPGKNTLAALANQSPAHALHGDLAPSIAPVSEGFSTLAMHDAKESVSGQASPVIEAAAQEEKKGNQALPPNSNTSRTATDSLQTSQNPETASGSVKRHRLSVQVLYAPELTKRAFTKDHDTDDNLKMNDDDYKERELVGPSFSMGIKAGYDLSERWKIHIGLSYYSISQHIQPLTLFTQKGGDGANHFVLNTSAGSAELPNEGAEPLIKDSLMLTNPSSQVLHYLNIPLNFEFRIYGFRSLSCYAFAGAYFSYLLDSRLVMEVTKNAATEVYTFSSLQGTNKFMLGLNAGLGLQYDLSKKLSLLAEPGAKFAVSPLNSNTAVKCYPYSFALTFGLGYHF